MSAVSADPLESWCPRHRKQVQESAVKPATMAMRSLLAAMREETFYATAYRIENGEGLPDGRPNEVPKSRRPSTGSVREAAQRHSPLCCYLDDRGLFDALLIEA